jgi:hypothetical protein
MDVGLRAGRPPGGVHCACETAGAASSSRPGHHPTREAAWEMVEAPEVDLEQLDFRAPEAGRAYPRG